MRSLNDLKTEFQKGYKEQQAKQGDAQTNHRKFGWILLAVVVMPVTIGNYVGYQATGRFIIPLLAINLVFPVLSLWMVVTGKNPLRKRK